MVAPGGREERLRRLTPEKIAPLVRGCRYLEWSDGVLRFCRLPEMPINRYPVDSWHRAHQSAGVRLEFTTDAPEWELRLRHPTAEAGARTAVYLDGVERAGAWAQGDVHLRVESGGGKVELFLPPMAETEVVAMGLPEGAALTPPAPPRVTWLAFGDSITQGEGASDGAHTYVEGVRRRLGLGSTLEVLNVGLSGAARGEPSVAEGIAQMSCDLITVAVGTNVYGQGCYDASAWAEVYRNFLAIVRASHPATPLVAISPIWRASKSAESSPNGRGLDHRELRRVTEQVVRERMAGGDRLLTLVGGLELLGPGEPGLSADGLHPGDEGTGRIAERLTPLLRRILVPLLAGKGSGEGWPRP